MGDPKKQRKKYASPKFPWRTDILQAELGLLGQYGLRNKHELWRNETMLSKFRGIARSLIGESTEQRKRMEDELLGRLKRLGILPETAVLDDVLDLTIEAILERRLQTIIFRKGLSKTIQQSRQLITHGHIMIGSRRTTIPGYIVTKQDENQVKYSSGSSFANPEHPLRKTIAAAPTSGTGSEEIRKEEE
jgi:small subunit ribosomal protein S4